MACPTRETALKMIATHLRSAASFETRYARTGDPRDLNVAKGNREHATRLRRAYRISMEEAMNAALSA
jgi:hypothetical protein